MLLDEARISSRIHHPNVVQTVDVVHERDELCLIMDYVHGVSLADVLAASRKDRRPVPPAVASAIVVDVLRGLHAAHEAKGEDGAPLGIVHRDVSPQNVLVGADGAARVLDFGIAKALRKEHLTISGEVKGKLSYMSPEQLRGAAVTRQADLFSAGILLWEALAGRRLYVDGEPAAVMLKVLTDVPAPPSEHAAGVSPELDAVVMRVLAHEPRTRFATAEEMAVALADACAPAPREDVARFLEYVAAEELERRLRREREAEAYEVEEPRLVSAPAPRMSPAPSPPVAYSRPSPPPPALRKRYIPLSFAIVVALVVAGGLVGLAFRKHRARPAAVAEPPAAESVAAPVEPPPADSAAPDPLVIDIDDLPAAAAKPARPAPRKPKAKNPCDPPYSIDPSGKKHYKPECLP
jgi:serine/threonine-protein kinase